MKVNKTIKLFINGEFPRTESGRSYPFYYHQSEDVYARVCQASRKDLRNTVEVAKDATQTWSKRSAYNKSQILYRMAEMCEGKREEFSKLFIETLGLSDKEANAQVDQAIDAFVYYSGFCDKYQQLIGAVNPINGPFHNFTTPEALGVVAIIDEEDFHFGKLTDRICSVICSGNSAIVLLTNQCPAVLAPLAEVFATSDLPAGVVNLLTGKLDELKEHVGTHLDILGISFHHKDQEILNQLKSDATQNMKRVIKGRENTRSLENILDFVEYKTIWHPIGV